MYKRLDPQANPNISKTPAKRWGAGFIYSLRGKSKAYVPQKTILLKI